MPNSPDVVWNMGKLWLIVAGISLGAYAARVSFLLLAGRVPMPVFVKRALRFVPPAVLAAIVLPALLVRDNAIDLALTNDRLIAGLAAGVVAWRTRNVILTIVVGMGLLWLLQRA